MKTVLKQLWNDERGFIVSAEIVLIVTIGVLGMVVGISSVASSINNELNDISGAFGAADQSYWYSGMVKFGHSGVPGSAYADSQDYCDCTTIVRTVPGAKIHSPARVPHSHPHPPRVKPPAVIPPSPCPGGPCDVSPCPNGCPPAYRPLPCPVPPVIHDHGHPHRDRTRKAPHRKSGPRFRPHPDPKFKRRKSRA